ncbi:proteasome subunit alpha type-1-like [Babylonia areolata]|uniref:proteasome subunit alpha type-1-like n=1 Tax=Babylonia areolata TaxID=304850 RepID=UPI003FCFCA6E
MFRNQYDNDVTTWSPQGRIHQLEYAMEAVKQGSVAVGIKSNTHVILVALKRAPSELSAYQKKIVLIDDHVAVAIAGLTADARLLCNFMRSECLDSNWAYNQPLPVSRLVSIMGSKSHIPTQKYGRRPFGVGLLIAGYDSTGSHIYQACPSANYYDCKAMAVGARSQSARTYLEKHINLFPDCILDELVKHGLRALRDTLPSDVSLNTKNCSLGIVGKGVKFTLYDDENVASFLSLIEGEKRPTPPDSEQEDAPVAGPLGGDMPVPVPVSAAIDGEERMDSY